MDTIFLGADTKTYEKYKMKTFDEVRDLILSSDDGFLNRLRTRVKSDKIKVKKVKANIEAFLEYFDSLTIKKEKAVYDIKIISDEKIPIEFIYHMADIHIDTKLDRSLEYQHVFQRLYEKLRQENRNGIIVLVGDILDKKLSLQPECIITTLNFFKELASICPVIVIAGNHDMIEHNPDRVDSLTAILHEKNIPNLHYLKESGVYQYNNCLFGVSSLLDGKFVSASDIADCEGSIKIGLWHGTVDTSKNLVGFELCGNKLLEDFDGYDICCLGDVHNYQYLNDSKTIAYSSSLVCQNYGEANDPYHGYLRWNLVDKSSDYQIIENDYMHMSFTLRENKIMIGKIMYDLTEFKFGDLPKSGKFRVKYDRNTDPLVVEQFMDIIRNNTESPTFDKKPMMEKITELNQEQVTKSTVNDHLIEYCQKKGFDIESIIKEITNINPNILIKENKKVSQWKLLSIKFDNMFGYGENNAIDFTRFPLNEVVGIYAKNGWGKSSLIDIILFMLFGRTSRSSPTQRSDQVPTFLIHADCNSFKGEITLSIGSDIFCIKKSGKKIDEKRTKVEVSFYQNGIDKSDEHRLKTEAVITDLIGSYKDFISTSVSLQSHNDSFKDKSQTEKKEFLTRMLKLDLLSDIHKDVEKETKNIDKQYAIVEDKIKNINLLQIEEDIQSFKICLENILNNINNTTQAIQDQKQLLELNQQKLHPVSSVKSINAEIENNQKLLEKCFVENKEFKLISREIEILKLHEHVETTKCQLLSKLHQTSHILTMKEDTLLEEYEKYKKYNPPELQNKITQNGYSILEYKRQITTQTHIDDFDISDTIIIEKELEEYINIETEYEEYVSSKKQLENDLKMCISFKEKLDKHEYNPECEFCVNNPLVKEFKTWSDKIPGYQESLLKLEENNVCEKKSIYEDLTRKLQIIISSHARNEIKILLQENTELLRIIKQKEKLELEMKALQNKKTKEEIQELVRTDLYDEFRKEKIEFDKIREMSTKKELLQDKIKQAQEDLKLSQENELIYNQIKKLQTDIINLQEVLNSNYAEQNNLTNSLQNAEQKQYKYKLDLAQKESLEERKHLYNQLSLITSKNGLSLYMLEYYLPLITETVNKIIEPYINRTISLSLDNKKDAIEMNAFTNDKFCVNVFSGAESFITDLAFKITLGYYSVVSKTSMIFIDEAMSCLDADKIKNIETFLEFLKSHYECSFMITHIQGVKEHTPHTIEINKVGNKSYIV